MSKILDRMAIVLVHGTNDSQEVTENKKWWQADSEFATRLQKSLESDGIKSDLFSQKWTGDNSDLARERGARKLRKFVSQLRKRYSGVHLICHSHGGNVALMALEMAEQSWLRRYKSPIGLTTVGTPFFSRRLDTMKRFSLRLFLLLAAVATPLWLYGLAQNTETRSAGIFVGMALASLLVLTPIVLLVRTAIVSLRLFNGSASTKLRNIKALSIWHDEDEAISLLRQLEQFQPNTVPKGALFRATGISAIVVALQVTLLFTIVWISLVAATRMGVDLPPSFGGNYFERLADSRGVLFSLLPLVSFLFIATYVAWRIIAGLVPELFLRQRLNRQMASMVRNMAYGQDGINSLASIETHAEIVETQTFVINGELSERMRKNSAEGTSRLFERHRSSVFSISNPFLGGPSSILDDDETWDCLIHTTYFDYEEVGDLVSDHIKQVRLSRLTTQNSK